MKAILDVMDKRNNRPLDADTEEYLDPYSVSGDVHFQLRVANGF
jgi:hypothetical protein